VSHDLLPNAKSYSPTSNCVSCNDLNPSFSIEQTSAPATSLWRWFLFRFNFRFHFINHLPNSEAALRKLAAISLKSLPVPFLLRNSRSMNSFIVFPSPSSSPETLTASPRSLSLISTPALPQGILVCRFVGFLLL